MLTIGDNHGPKLVRNNNTNSDNIAYELVLHAESFIEQYGETQDHVDEIFQRVHIAKNRI